MVSLCYKREKRIESQLSKLITAKPIYSDRVISCPAFIELRRVFNEIVFRANVGSHLDLLASAADSKTKASYEKTNRGDSEYYKERNVPKNGKY